HRLLMPRHPPYTLTHLPQHNPRQSKMLASTMHFSKNNHTPPKTTHPTPQTPRSATARSLRTQQCTAHPKAEKQAVSTPPTTHTPTRHPTTTNKNHTPHNPHPTTTPPQQRQPQSTSRPRKLLRKEVIQPHLPVRLPCYDFVPIADPTFDHSLPQNGLGHGLRVL